MGLVRRALWPVVVLAAGVLVTSAGANVSHPSRVHKAPWYWLLLERIDLTTSRAGTVVLGLSPQRSLPLTAKLRFRVLAPSKSVANMTLSGTITCSNAGSIATQWGRPEVTDTSEFESAYRPGVPATISLKRSYIRRFRDQETTCWWSVQSYAEPLRQSFHRLIGYLSIWTNSTERELVLDWDNYGTDYYPRRSCVTRDPGAASRERVDPCDATSSSTRAARRHRRGSASSIGDRPLPGVAACAL